MTKGKKPIKVRLKSGHLFWKRDRRHEVSAGTVADAYITQATNGKQRMLRIEHDGYEALMEENLVEYLEPKDNDNR